jgi:hypothetical protein
VTSRGGQRLRLGPDINPERHAALHLSSNENTAVSPFEKALGIREHVGIQRTAGQLASACLGSLARTTASTSAPPLQSLKRD